MVVLVEFRVPVEYLGDGVVIVRCQFDHYELIRELDIGEVSKVVILDEVTSGCWGHNGQEYDCRKYGTEFHDSLLLYLLIG